MAKYRKYFIESWDTLEKHFRKGIIFPEQENDLTCYLYHLLLNKGVPPKRIKTEYTVYKGAKPIGYADLYIRGKLFVEAKMFPLGVKCSDNKWHTHENILIELADKMKHYMRGSRGNFRKPIIVMWNWKIMNKNEKMDHSLIYKLENLKTRLKKRNVIFIYGPK